MHGFLVVDKPRGMTSHAVVGLVRRRLNTRRVGHAGTLDPAAEGVLVIAVGRATTLIDRVQAQRKQYIARAVLGAASASDDIEGPLIESMGDVTPPDVENVRRALASFQGEIEQVPPAYSAIKVEGQRAYRRARLGHADRMPRRWVIIHAIELIAYTFPDVVFSVECSKGTYVRSIARDLGAQLGIPAYLHSLVRVAVGPFMLDDAWDIATVADQLNPATWPLMALHPTCALPDTATLLLDEQAVAQWYHGQPIPVRTPGEDAGALEASAFDGTGRWLGLASLDARHRQWRPRLVIGPTDGRRN